jgi:TonB family protein
MLFEKDEELELQPKRTRTLLISIGIHVILLLIFVLNPDLLTTTPKRIVRIMGQDYDLSKQELTELVVPPDALRPKAAPKPLVQPPTPQPPPNQTQPPPPPPPQQQQPPPPPPPPPKVIGPDDVIKEGARPDAQPKASRGDTTEQARAGGQQQEQPKPDPPKQQPPQGDDKSILARNTNPNALRVPSLAESAGRIVQQSIDEARKRYSQTPGGRTGLPSAQEDNPNFSTEEPTILSDTKGYDFGPYMNQVVNRVRYNWYSLIPEIARLGKKGRVVITFTILKDGKIDNPLIRANSGTEPLDRAAYGSIIASNPFPQLPPGFDGDHLVLQFTFLYNIR